MAVRFYLAEKGLRTGPHSLVVLKQMGEVHAITPDTLIAAENTPDEWSPLRDSQVLCDELIPTHIRYNLASARTLEPINHPANAPGLSVEELLRGNLARQEAAKGELLAPMAKHPNRRRLDYAIMVVLGNLFVALGWFLLPATPLVLVPLFALAVIYNIGLAWLLYGVMDRY